MDSDLRLILRTAERLERTEAALREEIAASGALPGEVRIVIRLNQIDGRDRLGSMRVDLV